MITSRHRPAALRVGAGLTLLALLGASLATTASAAPPTPADLPSAKDLGVKPAKREPRTVVPNRWIVQLSNEPAAEGGSVTENAAQQKDVQTAAKKNGVTMKVTRSYAETFNGFTITAKTDQIAALKRVSGVTAVYPVFEVPAPTDKVAKPELKSALGMTGADVAQSELGFTGRGIRVGVIDSGIDYNHPDLGGRGTNNERRFPNARVVGGYDFVGDAYDASGELGVTTPSPDPYPDDCGGHGTHVAGIIGASGDFAAGGVRGVAPQASLNAYRVFGCDGSSDSDVILAAMERAATDGMHVVNMSLGAAFETWPTYPTAQAVDALSARGVTVVVSQGNEGEAGTFSGGAPAVARSAISVASFDNVIATHTAFTISPDDRQVPFVAAEAAPLPPSSGSLLFAAAGPAGLPAALGCTPPLTPDVLGGKAALISRGDCSFHEKALNAQNAGASAVILYNNTPEAVSPTVQGDQPITIPVVMIPQEDGLAIQQLLTQGPVTLNWTTLTVERPNANAGLVSGFSSYGLAADLTLKPDLGAPGGSIWSTYPLEKNRYANLSGTSMAAPHVAGAAALLMQARPEFRGRPLAVRTQLQNSAKIADWSGIPGKGYLEPVVRQGAGLLKIDAAITAKTAVRPGKVSLGEGQRGPVTTTFTLTNSSRAAVTYTVGHTDGVQVTGTPSAIGFDEATTGVRASATTVRVPARGSAKVRVTLTPPTTLPNASLYGGWVTFTSPVNTMVVPYGGLTGDYQAVKVLTDSPLGIPLPALGKVGDQGLGLVYPTDPPPVYTMRGDDLAYLVMHLEYPVQGILVEVYRARADGTAGRPVHPIFRFYDYLEEQGRDASYTIIPFDGTRQLHFGNDKNRVLPNGDYVLKVRILKALGNPLNVHHWETWTTPDFRIARPST